MDKFLVMLGNWKSTLIGLLMGLVIYEAGVGNKFPATAQEWWALGLGVLAITLGVVTKDATTSSRPLVLLLALPLLAGCATIDRAKADLAAFTQADIDQAIAMASQATDAEAPYRARCYTALKKYAASATTPGGPTLPKGAVSAFELAAELDQKARGGVGLPQELRADCAVILISATEFAARMGLKFAPIPGASAVGGLLPGLK